MARFIVDANLPFRIQLFHSEAFVSALTLGLAQSDSAIWNYAVEHNLTIISRDIDFYQRLAKSGQPPTLI